MTPIGRFCPKRRVWLILWEDIFYHALVCAWLLKLELYFAECYDSDHLPLVDSQPANSATLHQKRSPGFWLRVTWRRWWFPELSLDASNHPRFHSASIRLHCIGNNLVPKRSTQYRESTSGTITLSRKNSRHNMWWALLLGHRLKLVVFTLQAQQACQDKPMIRHIPGKWDRMHT